MYRTSLITYLITYNIQDEPVTVTIDYIENTEALGALLALMYLDQDGNIVCSQSIYAAIRRSDNDFMGDLTICTFQVGCPWLLKIEVHHIKPSTLGWSVVVGLYKFQKPWAHGQVWLLQGMLSH